MTREEAKRILGENATEEQISNLLNSFHNSLKAKEDENKSLKSKLDSQKDYETIKAELDEINKAKMSESERIAEREKEVEEKLSKANKILNSAQAKNILADYGLSDEVIEKLVSDDETTTINNANLFKVQLDSYKENIIKNVKSEIASMDIKPTQTNIPQETGMTKEKFSSMTMLEQKQWKDQNLDKYHEMFPTN